MKKKIVLASGGTGGHLFPAVATSEKLLSIGYHTILVTDNRAKKYCKPSDFSEILNVHVRRNHKFFGRLIYPFSLILQTINCIKLFKKNRPDLVLGFGGYPSLPPMIAAQLLKIPTAIHEQNIILGRANRFLQKRAKIVATSFSNTKFVTSKNTLTGNPLRKEFANYNFKKYETFKEGEEIKILVVGGSQGARIFSEVVSKSIEKLPNEIQKRFYIYQQCREELLDTTKKVYEKLNCKVSLEPFFKNMAELFNQSHLIISRAGASTIAEILFSCRPSLLIPLAISLDGDQLLNAKYLQDRQSAKVMLEKDFTIDNLSKFLLLCYNKPSFLQNISDSLEKIVKHDGADNLSKLIDKLINNDYLKDKVDMV